MEDPLWGQIILQIALIALNAIFACAEIAVISINDNRLAQLARQGDKRAVRLERLTSQPARFLATIQVAITLSGFLGSAFAADNFAGLLVEWLLSVGVKLPISTLNTICVVVITVILSYFTLVFGELVPKRLAMKKAESLALGISGLVAFISKLCAPVVSLLTFSTNGILRLMRIDPDSEDDEVSEEEIRMLVDAGSEKGVIDAEEQELIHNVFEFGDTSVGEFATHRKDMAILWLDDPAEVWDEAIRAGRHSMYPVCGASVDDVTGILNAKDYFLLDHPDREAVLREAVHSARFVPESLRADKLFRQMKKTHNHFAVVLDEYGGTEGIVTMNDLLEQLVGDLEDNAAVAAGEQPDIVQVDENTWRIAGSASLDEVAEQLQAKLPVEEYDTFGGFVFGEYGSVPDDGSEFEIETGALRVKAMRVRDHRLEEAVVEKNEEVPEELPTK